MNENILYRVAILARRNMKKKYSRILLHRIGRWQNKDLKTCRGYCAETVEEASLLLQELHIPYKIVSVNPPGGGNHIVLRVEDYILDPTINQYADKLKLKYAHKYVWNLQEYPLRIKR